MVLVDDLAVVRRYRMRPPPLDIVGLIRDLGIEYREIPMPEENSGRIDRYGDRFVITVNKNEGIQRQRFTAAHECAHFLLHRDLLKHGHADRLFGPAAGSNPPDPFTRQHEYQANNLAADLLMPASDIKRRYPDEGVDALARRYQVSRAAMAVRLRSLGLAA